MHAEAKTCDVLIIGGGLAGASLACALENSGLAVALIEAHPLHAQTQPCYDDRTVALSYGSRVIFEAMGLWPAMADRIEAIKTIHISDRGHLGVTRLRHLDEGVEALGYVAENRVLGEVLYQRLVENQNVQLHCPAQVLSLQQQDDSVQLCYAENGTEHELSAGLVVVADGVSSATREMLQIGTSRQDYQQSAIITNVTPGQSHQNIAYERFTDTGPLAFLPMTDHRCSVVWTVPTGQVDALLAMDDEAFLEKLQQRFGYRLGRLRKVGQRQVYPLALVESTQLVRGRVVIVGNAAHAIHPVAGQGFNLALRDVALLAELLSAQNDAPIEETLANYQAMRTQDARRVYRFTDTLVKVFSNDFPPLAHARAAALLLTDLMPAVKHRLARQSMGLSGRLSRLGRGLSMVKRNV
ncbi:MAG: 2-octaprenyl-6-methoxyphenyl hydroxylase [Gammaproteobacteria bacterium]|jgi:2-octaprenyl-6-methoxyphenol hydroxylase|nr:2-octaprenyl-6-methoxyphenyl hydroxylase [Gammaproteobacteria bacterium]